MARIQVLPLTTEKVGDVESTPFVLIIDQVEDAVDDSGRSIYTPELVDYLGEEVGSRMILVVNGTLDVANVDEELHRAAQAAVERALCPERTVQAP